MTQNNVPIFMHATGLAYKADQADCSGQLPHCTWVTQLPWICASQYNQVHPGRQVMHDLGKHIFHLNFCY